MKEFYVQTRGIFKAEKPFRCSFVAVDTVKFPKRALKQRGFGREENRSSDGLPSFFHRPKHGNIARW